jgi:rod shape determining protein RodA
MDLVAGRVWADERRPLRHVDWFLLVLALGLVVVGLFLLYSATNQTLRQDGFDPFARVKKQAITAVLGAIIMLLVVSFDYRFFKVYAGFIYTGTLLALVLVRVPGIGSTDTIGAAQRWFEVAGFQITPSEFTKLSVIVMLATVLSELRSAVPTVRDLIRLLTIAAIPLVLLVVAGTRTRQLVVLAVVGTGLIFSAFRLGVIEDYQLNRVTAFLDPANAPEDARYNLDQSLIAVGSGGLFGKGYLGGTQTNLDYVPEQHTDFIFTVAGEEFGFVGAMLILLLYALLLWRAIRIASLAKDPFGTYVAAGIASMFAIQMFVNIGMVVGIMPITGIPLPFLSYGGSSIIACFIAIGMLESIHMRRFT